MTGDDVDTVLSRQRAWAVALAVGLAVYVALLVALPTPSWMIPIAATMISVALVVLLWGLAVRGMVKRRWNR